MLIHLVKVSNPFLKNKEENIESNRGVPGKFVSIRDQKVMNWQKNHSLTIKRNWQRI